MGKLRKMVMFGKNDDYVPETTERKRFSIKRWAAKTFLIATLATGGAFWASFQLVALYHEAYSWAEGRYRDIMAKVTRVEVRKELVRSDAVPLPHLIRAVAEKQKFPHVVLQAVVEQESSGGDFVYRFEPNVYNRLKSQSRLPDGEVRMLASSHGVAHVMGFNAQPRCGVHWSKLYDPGIGLGCAGKILREAMDKHKSIQDPSRRIWLALRDYNGAGREAEEYATTVMARIGELLLLDVGRTTG